MTLKIAIIGCGVAGSVLAAMLAGQPDIEMTYFEKTGLGDQSEAGTGLNVGPNAIKALGLTNPALAAAVRAASYDWARWKVCLTDGNPVFDFAITELADQPGIRIRWSELYRVLRAPVQQLVRFGTTVTACDYDPTQPGKLFVKSVDAHGAALEDTGFDMVVVTDGRYSVLRPQFGGAWLPRHIGVTIYRLLVDDTSGGLMDDYGWWFNGAKRLLAFRVPDDKVYIAGSFPMPPGGSIPADQQTPEALAAHYWPPSGKACPGVAWMVDQLITQHSHIHWARLQESPLLFKDSAGHVLFLGDSAHGMVPTLGQGASQSMEDACVAGAMIVRSADRPVPQITSAIAAAREERLRFVMDLSMDATAAMLSGADGSLQMQRLRSPDYQAHFKRLWSDVTFG